MGMWHARRGAGPRHLLGNGGFIRRAHIVAAAVRLHPAFMQPDHARVVAHMLQHMGGHHHLPPAELPPANAICNPKVCAAEDLPYPHLAGVGVAFYLMGAVNAALAPHTGKRHNMGDSLDLVALGTLADVMPLTGENRVLVRGGLVRIARALRPGMAALKVASGMSATAALSAGQAVFRLAPRINAAGRMGAADKAADKEEGK